VLFEILALQAIRRRQPGNYSRGVASEHSKTPQGETGAPHK
jgi:hypothetical protein